MTGIAGANASEVGHAQKQITDTSYVQKTNQNTTDSNILRYSAPTQKKADAIYLNKHKKVFKTNHKKVKQSKDMDKHPLSSRNIHKVKNNDSMSQKDICSDIQTDSPVKSQNITTNIHQYSRNDSQSCPVNHETYNENNTGFTENETEEEPLASGATSSGTYQNPSLDPIIAPASVQVYLNPSASCQSTDPRIKSLAAAITRGIPTGQVYNRANAIFNWVRDNLDYSFYYNTKKGAVGALTSRKANCCDTSHLLVALLRASGIPARYAYGSCQFSSGKYGHVWVQVYVVGKWYTADATSNSNSFNVIRNWNTRTYTLKGIWASLPF